MTLIENDSPKVQYTGPFIKGQLLPLTFPYIATEDVKMIIDNKPAIFNVDYEIITEPNDEHPVAYPNSAYIKNDLPNTKQITLYRVTPLDQQVPFPQQSKFRSERIEQALDKLTMQQQEQEEQLSRCIIAPITLETFNGQLPEPAADQALKWNTECTELENYDIIGAQEAFETEINTRFEEQSTAIENRIDQFENNVNTRFAEQSTAIENRINQFENNVNTSFEEQSTAIENRINQFENEIDNKFVDYKNTVDSNIQGFKNDVNQTIDANQAELLEIANNSASIASQAMKVAQSTIDTANTARQIAEAAEAKSDSAVTVANSANTNATNAVSTAEGAVTIATNASAKSDNAVATANTAQKQAEQAVTTANTAVETANNTQHRVNVFEEDINTVLDAADKILELDKSVQTAVNAAELANQAAETATKAADEAVSSLESKADLEDIKNGTLIIQNNGTTIATFSANQDSNVTANLLIPDALTAGTGISISGNTISNAFTSLDNYTTFSSEALNNEQSFIYKSTAGSYLRGNFRNFVNSIIKPTFATKTELAGKSDTSHTHTASEVGAIANKEGTITAELVTDGTFGTIKLSNGSQNYYVPRILVATSSTGTEVMATGSANGRVDLPNIFTKLGAAKKTDLDNLSTSKQDNLDIALIEGENW